MLYALNCNDVSEENAAQVASFLSTEILEGIINNTIEQRKNHFWATFFKEACQAELEIRLERMLLG